MQLSAPAMLELIQAVLDKGVPFRFQAKGFSMSPFIKDGDIITVSPLINDHIRTGDVVAFTHLGIERLAVHRVVGKKYGYYLVRGDNISSVKNDLIPETNILGKMSKVEREGQEIFLGLGPERFLIALLARKGLLPHLLTPLLRLVRPFIKRMAL